MRNQERAQIIKDVLDAGLRDNDCNDFEAIIDLLTNAMHFCHQYDVDINHCLSIATSHFCSEVKAEM